MNDIERRYISGTVSIEKRANGSNTRNVSGYAATFNNLSKDLGGFQERIDPGFFKGVDFSDVVCLFNHDKNFILARTSSRTLKLSIDNTGLKYAFEAPATSAGNDLLVNIANRDVSGSSFAFIVEKDSWDVINGINVRTLLKCAQLIDVSPVVFPAYNDTVVGQRSFKDYRSMQKKFPELQYTKWLINEINLKQ
ncbi:MAG: HK97 family phage prohead protease [Bacteroidota bacterium]|nr:HK97 family phage prohead protease [Bacteroidota bacterium]